MSAQRRGCSVRAVHLDDQLDTLNGSSAGLGNGAADTSQQEILQESHSRCILGHFDCVCLKSDETRCQVSAKTKNTDAAET